MTQSESGGGSGCVRTSKGPQNPSQGFIRACQLFNWTFLDRIYCINFIIGLAILDTSYLKMHFFGTHTCLCRLQNCPSSRPKVISLEVMSPETRVMVSFRCRFHGDSKPKISNGNRTEWSPIPSVIIRVINKIGWPRSGSPICLITSDMTMYFGQHDSGSGQYDFGRDDFRVTWPVTSSTREQ